MEASNHLLLKKRRKRIKLEAEEIHWEDYQGLNKSMMIIKFCLSNKASIFQNHLLILFFYLWHRRLLFQVEDPFFLAHFNSLYNIRQLFLLFCLLKHHCKMGGGVLLPESQGKHTICFTPVTLFQMIVQCWILERDVRV